MSDNTAKTIGTDKAVLDSGLSQVSGPNASNAQITGTEINNRNQYRQAANEYDPKAHIGQAQNTNDLSTSFNDKKEAPQSKDQVVQESYLATQEKVITAIKNHASTQARLDFNAGRVDLAAIKERIHSTLKDSNISITKEFESRLAREFKNEYRQTQDRIYSNELNWFQRRYHDINALVSSGTKAIGQTISSTVTGINNARLAVVGVAEASVEIVVDVSKGAASVVTPLVKKSWDVVSDPETYKSIARGVKNVVVGTKDFAVAVGRLATDPETYATIGRGVQAVGSAIASGAKATWNFLSDPEMPQKVWNGVKQGFGAVVDVTYQIVKDPGQAFKTVSEFVTEKALPFAYQMAETLGLVDIWDGCKSFVSAQYNAVVGSLTTAGQLFSDFGKVISGQISVDELKNNLKQNVMTTLSNYGSEMSKSLKAIKGGAILALEVTGIMDIYYTADYSLKAAKAFIAGDTAGVATNLAMAGMHGAFAAGSIAAIAGAVASAGTGTPVSIAALAGISTARATVKAGAKTALKIGVKEVVEQSAQQIGKEVVEKVSKELGQELIEKTAKEVADTGVHELAEIISKEGVEALNQETVKKVMNKASGEAFEKVLKEKNISQLVDQLVYKQLDHWSKLSTRQLAKELKSLGFENSKRTAKYLSKALQSGKQLDEMAEIYIKEISDQVSDHFQNGMEQAFKARFTAALNGKLRKNLLDGIERESLELTADLRKTLDDLDVLEKAVKKQADQLGVPVEKLIDDLVESGWEGARAGMREAVERVVREGVEAAFRRFARRYRKPGIDLEDSKKKTSEQRTVEGPEFKQQELGVPDRVENLSKANLTDGNRREIKVQKVVLPGGKIAEITSQFDPEENRFIKISEHLIDTSRAVESADKFAGDLKDEFGTKNSLELSYNREEFKKSVERIADMLSLSA